MPRLKSEYMNIYCSRGAVFYPLLDDDSMVENTDSIEYIVIPPYSCLKT